MSNAKIAVVNPRVSDAQRTKIVKTAEKYGASVDFYRTNADAIPHLTGVEIVYGGGADLLSAAKDAKWFCSASAGVDNYISSGALENREIILTNSSGSYGLSIAEHLIMCSLILLRRIPEYLKLIDQHTWKSNLSIRSLFGSNIVILGTGDIGSNFAKRVRGFSPASIVGVNRSGRQSEEFDKVVPISQLEEVIGDVDLFVMCLPGTKETTNLLSRELISKLPAKAYILNVGRGSAIDEEALVEALKEGRIAGAALDVLKTEPLPADDPLWDVEGLVITPHISGQENLDWTRDNNYAQFCEDMENYFNGRPMAHLVDIKAGY